MCFALSRHKADHKEKGRGPLPDPAPFERTSSGVTRYCCAITSWV